MTNVSINLGNGYKLSIAQEWLDKNKVEVALLHDDTFVNTSYWYYANANPDIDYDDVVRYLDADKLLTALVKAKSYAKGE